MKSFLIFILISLSSLLNRAFGCGPYYPYGEDVRFSIFNPAYFNYPEFASFNYSANLFFPDDIYTIAGKDEQLSSSYVANVTLWMKRCEGSELTVKEVYNAVYFSDKRVYFDPLEEKYNDPFFNYLLKKGDTLAINYLLFANKCSGFNSFIEDPWERNDNYVIPKRRYLIDLALKQSEEIKDKDLKQRYAFLAIRMAFYNNDREQIIRIYNEYFRNKENKNIIDYWALHFYATTEKDGGLRNFYVSQVFAFAPDKRFALNDEYEQEFPVKQTLKHASNDKEKEAVWLLDGIENPGKAIINLQNIYALNPASEAFSFLLIREINKLEDWIYTPYYSNFEPSVAHSSREIGITENENGETVETKDATPEDAYSKLQKRIETDRLYAKELLNLLNSTNKTKVENLKLIELAKAYLAFMCKDYKTCLAGLKAFNTTNDPDKKFSDQNAILKALCLVADQTDKAAIIPEEIKSQIVRQSELGNDRFIFAIARELEYKGNTTDAAILLSHINTESHAGPESYWRAKSMNATLWSDFYYEYFHYLDAQYTTEELNRLIADIQNNKTTDTFSLWKYKHVREDLSRLYDLNGTKYIRKNDLKNALTSYQKVGDSLWKSYPYATYLNANPFYTDFYAEHSATIGDTITFTKKEIVSDLMAYLKKAENPGAKKREYYYFLVANCYLNMSYYGNSWMMRRYYWSTAVRPSGLVDEAEYYGCDLAKSYYLKAKQFSKNEKFSALCLRMAARCEWYKLLNTAREDSYNNGEFQANIFEQNRFYSELKQKYPGYYEELTSNCESFGKYFREGSQ